MINASPTFLARLHGDTAPAFAGLRTNPTGNAKNRKRANSIVSREHSTRPLDAAFSPTRERRAHRCGCIRRHSRAASASLISATIRRCAALSPQSFPTDAASFVLPLRGAAITLIEHGAGVPEQAKADDGSETPSIQESTFPRVSRLNKCQSQFYLANLLYRTWGNSIYSDLSVDVVQILILWKTRERKEKKNATINASIKLKVNPLRDPEAHINPARKFFSSQSSLKRRLRVLWSE